jgi:hypothetical protein
LWRESQKTVAVDTSVTIAGVKETLRELQKLEPELAKDIKRDFKQIVDPIVKDARSKVLAQPLSGFARNWKAGALMPWNQSSVSKSIIARFSNRKRGNALAVFSVTMKSPAGTIFDMAGRKSANRLAQTLSALYGAPSRLMWPAYDRNANEVNQNLERVVEKITDATTRRLTR